MGFMKNNEVQNLVTLFNAASLFTPFVVPVFLALPSPAEIFARFLTSVCVVCESWMSG
jgi:hypothetical protein